MSVFRPCAPSAASDFRRLFFLQNGVSAPIQQLSVHRERPSPLFRCNEFDGARHHLEQIQSTFAFSFCLIAPVTRSLRFVHGAACARMPLAPHCTRPRCVHRTHCTIRSRSGGRLDWLHLQALLIHAALDVAEQIPL